MDGDDADCVGSTADAGRLQSVSQRQTRRRKSVSNATTIAGPATFHQRVSQYIFLSDFALNKNLPIFQELSDLRDQVFKELQLPESNRLIQVYLFENEAKYKSYMAAKYPDLPIRRAFFIEQPHHIGCRAN